MTFLHVVNTTKFKENDRHFADPFVIELQCTLIEISLKFIPKSQTDIKLTLAEAIAWHQKGDKLIPHAMTIQFTDAYMRVL